MAVVFDASTTDKITVTNPLTLGAGTALTFMQWVRFTADPTSTTSRGTSKGAASFFTISLATTRFFINIPRDGTAALYAVALSEFTSGVDYFIAGTYSEGNGSILYRGTLTATIAALGQIAGQVGAGNTTTDTGDLWINNRGAANTLSFPQNLSFFALYDREFTLGELKQQQFAPHRVSGCKAFYFPWETTTIPDLSGNNKNGTGTGLAIATQHVSLRQPYRQEEWLPYIVSSAPPVTSMPLFGRSRPTFIHRRVY